MGKPRLIIIIRHAQSEGNRDKTIHQTTPDHKVGLTPEGHRQALEAGQKLRELLRGDDTLHFFISPYRRTRETTEGILNGLTSNDPAPSPFQRSHIKVYEEPRLREQDFGNFQPGAEEVERLWRERAEYGHFFYRIPNGESGADVYDRVSSFNGSLWRRFQEDNMASVAILVTHGLCSRIFLMVWYHYSVEFFEDLRNINHCEFLVMKQAANGRYVLQNQLRRWSDLRKERAAARRSISSASTPVIPETIPVRRWTSHRTANDPTGASYLPRPERKSTQEMFNDDPPVEEESTQNPAETSYLGRDGGGTRSGHGSPFGSDDEASPDTPPQEMVPEAIDPSGPKLSSSLARALRGDFDDDNRVMADALGDQSDADVDEADREIGTKAREAKEMEKILAEERQERSRSGSVY
ncbi:phosphoglycerate mutase-like protein, partial [Aureobasidium melanogenum]